MVDGADYGPRVTVRPRVHEADGSVALTAGDEAEVRTTVRRSYGQLQYGSEKVLRTDPASAGSIEVAWSVADGEVSDGPTVATAMSGELADCVVEKIRRWETPLDAEGRVSWTFRFDQPG